MSQYKAYPEYKCSKVEWIELMPDHWEIKPLKHLFSIIGGTTPSSEDKHWEGDINWFTPSDLKDNNSFYVYASKRKVTQEGFQSCGLKLIPKGSIILSSRAPIGSLGIMTSKGSTNQGCKALIPNKKASAKFFAYFLSVMSEPLNNLGDGTTFKEISSKDLESFCAPFASLEEQTAIATFLDRETSRIDRLIDAKKRFIERLKEKRQALISHAVTKGLDPNAPMKDSGVEWIGEIPEGWEVKALKREFIGFSGKDVKADRGHYKLHGANGYIGNCDTKEDCVEGGCVLVGRVGSAGAINFVHGELGVSDNAIVIKNTLKDVPRYNYYLFLSLKLDEITTKSANPLITSSNIMRIHFPFPKSISERSKIAEQLDTETHKIDSAINKTRSSIDLLNEKRTALITAAVTGKIDVRDEA